MIEEKIQNIIGRIEQVHLPGWEFYDIEAKIDTGAYTSSLHCHHVEKFNKNNEKWVRFNILDPEHKAYSEQLIETPVFDSRTVKSSNGVSELRYFVKTKIELYGSQFDIELSLADRSAMKYPLLIGRKFLKRGSFLVDVSRKNLSRNFKKKESQ